MRSHWVETETRGRFSVLTKIELIDIILRVVKETWLPFLVGLIDILD